MGQIRLDKLLVQRELVQSRERACLLIQKDKVFVDGKLTAKPSAMVDKNADIEIKGKDIPWVSRGGLKLEKALDIWKINPKGLVCLDIGASTGGFTDVLLSRGAKKIYAVDVGHNQLAEKLRNNPKVVNLEGADIRRLTKDTIKELVDFICIDVSFISLALVLPEAVKFLKPRSKMIVLIKPQFEVGRKKIGKGIVKKTEYHEAAVNKIKTLSEELGFVSKEVIESPILGGKNRGKGNKEFFLHLIKK